MAMHEHPLVLLFAKDQCDAQRPVLPREPTNLAEAQASYVGVCMQNIRADLGQYVGAPGYLFDSIEEAAEIVRAPFSAEKRQLGFEHARKSDVRRHIRLLEDLWQAA